MLVVVGMVFPLANCAISAGPGARRGPEFKPPTSVESRQMMDRMMGKAPKRDAPASTDGVQVVFQTGHAGGIRTVALSPNGRYIASSWQDATVKICDVASGQEVRTLTGYGGVSNSSR